MTGPDKLTYSVPGRGCVDCVMVTENAVNRLPGVRHIGVSLSTGTMTVPSEDGFDASQLA
jgi:Cation transport ATPase